MTIIASFIGVSGKAPQGASSRWERDALWNDENGSARNIGPLSVRSGNVEEVLHTFRGGSDGSFPLSGLTNYRQRFYGLTNLGGGQGFGELFSIDAAGSHVESFFWRWR